MLLGNVLAEPGVVGVSGGASVAMVILLLFFPSLNSPVAFMAAAVLGALLFTLLLVVMARKLRLTTARLLLVGSHWGFCLAR